jgi:hypothetical protein
MFHEIALSPDGLLAMTGGYRQNKSPSAFALGDWFPLLFLLFNQLGFAQRCGDRHCHYYYRWRSGTDIAW